MFPGFFGADFRYAGLSNLINMLPEIGADYRHMLDYQGGRLTLTQNNRKYNFGSSHLLQPIFVKHFEQYMVEHVKHVKQLKFGKHKNTLKTMVCKVMIRKVYAKHDKNCKANRKLYKLQDCV